MTPDKERRNRQMLLDLYQRTVLEHANYLDEAVRARDDALRRFHGDPATGGLSYREMAAATGLSRSRVIQIVQGESEYSKQLKAEHE